MAKLSPFISPEDREDLRKKVLEKRKLNPDEKWVIRELRTDPVWDEKRPIQITKLSDRYILRDDGEVYDVKENLVVPEPDQTETLPPPTPS